MRDGMDGMNGMVWYGGTGGCKFGCLSKGGRLVLKLTTSRGFQS